MPPLLMFIFRYAATLRRHALIRYAAADEPCQDAIFYAMISLLLPTLILPSLYFFRHVLPLSLLMLMPCRAAAADVSSPPLPYAGDVDY